MRAGLMRDYISIERNTPTQGDSGELIDAWTTLANAWVYLRASSGEEAINQYLITMRYRDITHTDRIVFGTRIFDIVTVLDRQGMGRELTLEVSERV